MDTRAILGEFPELQWDWESIEACTDRLADANLLGAGVLSRCYRGSHQDQPVAVRVLRSSRNLIGEIRLHQSEPARRAGVVQLRGWSISEDGKAALVSEFMPDRLDKALESMDTLTRLKVATDVVCHASFGPNIRS